MICAFFTRQTLYGPLLLRMGIRQFCSASYFLDSEVSDLRKEASAVSISTTSRGPEHIIRWHNSRQRNRTLATSRGATVCESEVAHRLCSCKLILISGRTTTVPRGTRNGDAGGFTAMPTAFAAASCSPACQSKHKQRRLSTTAHNGKMEG